LDKLHVTVYVWRDEHAGRRRWRAECITLCLVAEEPTFEGAIESIHESIDTYLRRSVRAAYAAPVPRFSPRRRRLRHWMRHQLSDLRPFHERYVYRMSNRFPLRPAL